jgi:cytosine/adenosine deaminase-related metal-dependent hydrolase
VILKGARRAESADTSVRGDLEIRDEKIYPCAYRRGGKSIDLSGFLLLPGLINAHDHLEFNLFPQLGRRLYSNAAEWAADIHRPAESPVKEHISVPLPVRLTWAHSLDFSPDLLERFLDGPAGWPFVVHAAEGTDLHAGMDIERLDELGVLAPHTVLVHAIAAGGKALDLLRRRGTSIVWCPRSNLSTYGSTLPRHALESGVRIAIGTDSAITSCGDLIDEIRTAVVDCGVSPSSVYRMVTSDAAAMLRLGRGEGSLRAGGVADIVAVRDEGQSPAEALLNLNPEFVMVGGRFRMLSENTAAGPLGAFADAFYPIRIASRDRCLIDADVAALYREAARVIGTNVMLSGRAISVEAVA